VTRGRVLVARLDSDGDVLLAGPAVRAVAAGAHELTLLCGPAGRQAAALLPGVDHVLEWAAPWIQAQPGPVSPPEVRRLVTAVREAGIGAAVVLTSFHQSPLPLALLLRLAGVAHLTAISEDYPGSLLDVRHHVPELIPESERALSVAAAAGYRLPPGDDGRLRVRGPLPDIGRLVGPGAYVVVHPGATVPARACPPALAAEVVGLLAGRGRRVVVTGGAAERSLTAQAAGTGGVDLGGRTTFAELAAVLAGADAVVVGNTGPAHLAAAVGTPVVSLFAPTVPYEKWRPYGVATVRLGDQHAACRGTRARTCPVPGHPCLSTVSAADVAGAVAELEGIPA
jgi:ADP-heptose:LPS heptosyltransferase